MHIVNGNFFLVRVYTDKNEKKNHSDIYEYTIYFIAKYSKYPIQYSSTSDILYGLIIHR